LVRGDSLPDNGSLLVGEKATLLVPHGRDDVKLFGESGPIHLSDVKQPDPFLPRSPGHHEEWIVACKGGPPALSNFDYAAELTESVLLGNIACRVGKRFEWNPVDMSARNCPEVALLVQREYRSGWKL
jgi:hypothetical protein